MIVSYIESLIAERSLPGISPGADAHLKPATGDETLTGIVAD